jgi:hypothetical protein
MRTTLAEQVSDRRGDDTGHDDLALARDNPRRRRESHDEREDAGRHGNRTHGPLRHGIQHVRGDFHRLARTVTSR